MQCKDIPDLPILQFLDVNKCYDFKTGCNWFGKGFKNSIHQAMPPGTPEKLVLAKMRALIKRGLVDGCACGCRGDFHLTDKGRATPGLRHTRFNFIDEECNVKVTSRCTTTEPKHPTYGTLEEFMRTVANTIRRGESVRIGHHGAMTWFSCEYSKFTLNSE